MAKGASLVYIIPLNLWWECFDDIAMVLDGKSLKIVLINQIKSFYFSFYFSVHLLFLKLQNIQCTYRE